MPEAVNKAHKSIPPGETPAPDFRPETPEVFTPAPEMPAVNTGESANAAALREQGINPDTGLSLEEIMVAEQERLGPLPEEEAAALNEAREAEAARRRIEEKGWEMMACVMEVKE